MYRKWKVHLKANKTKIYSTRSLLAPPMARLITVWNFKKVSWKNNLTYIVQPTNKRKQATEATKRCVMANTTDENKSRGPDENFSTFFLPAEQEKLKLCLQINEMMKLLQMGKVSCLVFRSLVESSSGTTWLDRNFTTHTHNLSYSGTLIYSHRLLPLCQDEVQMHTWESSEKRFYSATKFRLWSSILLTCKCCQSS